MPTELEAMKNLTAADLARLGFKGHGNGGFFTPYVSAKQDCINTKFKKYVVESMNWRC
jgi:hypothetical protein